MLNHKHDLILTKCMNKKVLHIGATDFPYHKEKAKENNLLHQKINNLALETIGIDNNKDAIADLKKYGISNIFYGDILNQEYNFEIKKHKFDIIVFGDVIEHLTNPGIALDNIKKIMDEKTMLIITTPNVWSIFHSKNLFLTDEYVHQDHTFWPSKKTMDNLIKKCNFQVASFDYVLYGNSQDLSFFKKIFKLLLNPFKHLCPILYYEVKIK